jgi:hypothetical protein
LKDFLIGYSSKKGLGCIKKHVEVDLGDLNLLPMEIFHAKFLLFSLCGCGAIKLHTTLEALEKDSFFGLGCFPLVV